MHGRRHQSPTRPTSASAEYDLRWVRGLTRVTVKLGRGRGLVSRDRNGLSDPYCIVYVGNKERKFKTDDVHSAPGTRRRCLRSTSCTSCWST